jgi:hypothetical protein
MAAGDVVDMLTLPGFIDAEILIRREPPAAAGCHVLCVRYRLRDREAWQSCVASHAPRPDCVVLVNVCGLRGGSWS